MKVGICDWGIGGLGFYNLLRADRPDLDVVYLGDQGFAPYGKVSTPLLTARMRWVLEGFRKLEVDRVVVACNAASTVLDHLQVEGIEAYGVIKPTLSILKEEGSTVGLIGGRRTVKSGAYKRPLTAMGIDVTQRVAQPLSGLIESGHAHDTSARDLLYKILDPIQHVDRLVLACTHYVVLENTIREFMPHTKLIDPAAEVWARLGPTFGDPTSENGSTQYFTTGDPELMSVQARDAFGVDARVALWS